MDLQRGKQRTLRAGVELSPLESGVQLTDTSTGFAVELGANDAAALTDLGPDSARIWNRLATFGLTDTISDLKAVRRRQRDAFTEANPPILDRLRELLARIRRDVPFFRDRAALYDPQRINTFEDFRNLPFMRKSDVRQHFPAGLISRAIDLASAVRDGTLAILATSGSTDERLQIVTRSVIDRLPFGSEDLLGVPIGGKQPRTAFFTTPVCASMACRRAAGSFEERKSIISPDLYLRTTRAPFAMEASLLKEFSDDIERFQPTILAADPIYLQCLVRLARKDGVQLPPIQVVQRGFEFGTRAAIRDIGAAFSVQVLNDYGASEENRIAVECHRGSLHVRADVLHLEIIGESGLCAPGAVGAVALTTFDTATPLVRYLIGDAAAWTGETCDCAFGAWPTIELHGRVKDLLRSKNRWVTAEQIDEAIGAPDWLDFYRVSQSEPDAFRVMVIPAVGRTAQLDELSDQLEPYLSTDEIEYRIVSRLNPLPSMKIGTVQSCLPTPELP